MNPTNILLMVVLTAAGAAAQTDRGERGSRADAGQPLPGLTAAERAAFEEAKLVFEELSTVEKGLGPRFNGDSCAGCHIQPGVGGSSPRLNPQFAMATRNGAHNSIPSFLSQNGPIRVARQVTGTNNQGDGGVVDLFTIRGRADAGTCNAEQPSFAEPNNFRFRIPTPVFGAGLIEAIPDSALRANLQNSAQRRRQLGIQGRFNTSGNDGTITRFGWKAQNKSLLLFAGEAYNVEQGVTNHLFPTERDETPGCGNQQAPEDNEDLPQLALFMRLLGAPLPTLPQNSEERQRFDTARRTFDGIGCTSCHTPLLRTGKSTVTALSEKPVSLFSDLALHNMGQGLSDGIQQGDAQGAEWRTAPLWGLGQRLFFLHDGRSTDLNDAILQHSGRGSEANQVIDAYRQLPQGERQNLLDYLRSL